MQAETDVSNMATISIPTLPLAKPSLLTDDPEIRRTRRIIMIICSICIVICAIDAIHTYFIDTIGYCLKPNGRSEVIGQYFIAILLYSFALFVAYRYSETGLRVIVWLGIFELFVVAIVIIYLINSVTSSSGSNTFSNEYSTSKPKDNNHYINKPIDSIICILTYIGGFILKLIIVRLAFKLARLIDVKKTLVIKQIQPFVYTIV
ncbi:unnamed protein product [Rotaria sp. Silwood1]|nr:unnamed protein product [Rotaria sp. Silwood1]CAF3594926.1 unnamed protein product [Rotaria sp. Silwood1]CAF4781246.1 unnamed protein product [Rotaria sp. Silwood1]